MIEIELRNYTELRSISDWVELYAAINGEVTKAQIDHILTNNSFGGDNEEYIGGIWSELKKRNQRYNGVTPMEIDGISVQTIIDWKDYPEYILMLILSLEGNGWKPQETGVLFERICKEALEEYIGGNAKVVGFPNKVSVRQICSEIEEEFRSELPARYKDRKLDVIGWKKIDNRNNKLLILMQCAAGANYRGKTTELQVDVWKDYINFGCLPTRAFAFAHCIEDDLFVDIGTEGGILFDRLRLYRFISSKQNPNTSLKTDLITWCNQRISDLKITA